MISGLVLYLRPESAAATLDILRSTPTVELGESQQNRVPAVIEASTPKACETLTDQLREISGVTHVDVVFVNLESAEDCCQESEAQ